MRKTPETPESRIRRYEGLLFELGAMDKPPCFRCGYNGPGYYQPDIHQCAASHHAAKKETKPC